MNFFQPRTSSPDFVLFPGGRYRVTWTGRVNKWKIYGPRSPKMLRNKYGRLGNVCYGLLHMVGRFREMAGICVT